MTVYKNKKSHSSKWLIALVIFVLGMTLTWAQADGAETSPVLTTHQTQTAHYSYGRSRFRPNWFPGFLKPKKTILASAVPLVNDTNTELTDLVTTRMVQPGRPTTLRIGYIGHI